MRKSYKHYKTRIMVCAKPVRLLYCASNKSTVTVFNRSVWLKGCNKLQNGNKCVDRCPPPELYNSRKMEMERTPDGKYAYKRLCMKRCPEHTITYRDVCLSRCPKGNYINNAHVCQQCSGSCPESKRNITLKINIFDYCIDTFLVCHISQAVTDLNIGSFENCTDVEGFIHIGKMSFESGTRYPTHEKWKKNDKRQKFAKVYVSWELFVDQSTAKELPSLIWKYCQTSDRSAITSL